METNKINEVSTDKRKNNTSFKENIKKYWPILLAHHPLCEKFDSHVIKIGKNKYCIGCLFGNSAGIISLISLFVLRFYGLLPEWNFIRVGLFLMLSYLLSIFGITKFRSIKIVSKILIGIGFSFILFSIWTLEYPLWVILFATALIMYICMLPINIKRIWEINKICQACEQKNENNECSGFKK